MIVLILEHGLQGTDPRSVFEGMKSMRIKWALSIFIVTQAVAWPVAAALAGTSPLAAADNGFGFQLLQQLSQDQPAQNIFISPYSASTVLQMVGNGAAGQTKTEMQQVLETANLSDADVNAANKKVAGYFNNQDTNLVLLSANNALWYRPNFTVKADFIAENRGFFDATVAALDFADPDAAGVINRWAEDKTHGKITHLADGLIDPSTEMVLANAVYFKAKWADPFKVRETMDRPFNLRDGSQRSVPMMRKTRSFAYRRGADFQSVRLPYQNEDLALYVFLPDANSTPEKMLNALSGGGWQNEIKPGFKDEQGLLVLPKFKFDYKAKLKVPLKTMGMKDAFDPTRADFSGIAPQQLWISAVLQKTFVDVNEQGTEAAAATIAGIMAMAIMIPPPNQFEMVVDRPFVVLIEDNQTGIILFMGVVFDPSAD